MKRRWIFCAAVCALFAGCSYSVPRYHAAPSKKTTAHKVVAQHNPASGKKITVKKGDTVYSLSMRHKVPIRALIQTNGLKAPFVLSVGSELTLPASATHVVRKGDTVYGISRAYGVDMSRLVRQNGIRFPYGVTEGQVLVLPGQIVTARTTVKKTSESKSAAAEKKQYARKSSGAKTGAAQSRVKLPAPPERASGKFAWPVEGGTVVASYGAVGNGRHNDGINIKAPEGADVRSAENGVVAYAGNELKGFGNLLLLKHADGWVTAYAHNKKLLVKRGQTVKRGDVIATVGKTGSAREPQLHFEVRKGTKAVNPISYLTKG